MSRLQETKRNENRASDTERDFKSGASLGELGSSNVKASNRETVSRTVPLVGNFELDAGGLSSIDGFYQSHSLVGNFELDAVGECSASERKQM